MYILKPLRIPGLVRCHSYHMFEVKSAREKQGRESAESAGDKYECGDIFECDKYMNIVKVKSALGTFKDPDPLILLIHWIFTCEGRQVGHWGDQGELGGADLGPYYPGTAPVWGLLPSVWLLQLARPLELTLALSMGLQWPLGQWFLLFRAPFSYTAAPLRCYTPPYPSLPWPGGTAHTQWLTSRGVGVWLPCLKVGWILKGNPCSLSDQAKARVTVALSLLTISLPYAASLTPLLLRALPREILCTRILVSGSASR